MKTSASRLIYVALALLFNSARADVILDWNPTLVELPPNDDHTQYLLGNDPTGWRTTVPMISTIKDVYIAPPIHPIPYEMVEEYNASHTGLSIQFDFSSPGVYVAKTTFVDTAIPDEISFFFVGAAKGSKGRSEDSRPTKIVQPFKADVILVEIPAVETGAGKGAMAVAAGVIDGEQRVSTVAEAITKVQAACTANGGPVSVELVGHGAPGAISVGAGTGSSAGGELINNSAATQEFVSKLKGCISKLTLKGCCVATNVNSPGRDHLMEVLADGLRVPVYAWDQVIYWVSGGLFRSGYAGIDVHGKQASRGVPSPQPLWLFAFWIAVIAARYRGKHRVGLN